MKKGYWKGFATGLLLTALVLGLGITAGAAGKTIAVEGGSNLTLNGAAYTPKDDKGNAIEYFSYNGVTYVPLRAFSKAVGIETSYNAATRTEALTTPDVYLPSEYITAAKAKELATAHAGVKAADTIFYQVKVSWKDSLPIYEVGFYSGNVDYFYNINALNGAVLGWNYVVMENSYPADYITADKAKELALSHAGVKAANATFDKVKVDWNAGQPIYEVEFHTGKTQYDYDINALNGAVVDWSTKQTGSADQGGSETYITADRAKEVALKDAGVKAADATFYKVKFDWDDGRAEYEVKFYSGSTEYEYDIDAKTAAILDRDIDTDDDRDDDWEDWYEWYGRHDNGNHYGWENGKGNPHHDRDD